MTYCYCVPAVLTLLLEVDKTFTWRQANSYNNCQEVSMTMTADEKMCEVWRQVSRYGAEQFSVTHLRLKDGCDLSHHQLTNTLDALLKYSQQDEFHHDTIVTGLAVNLAAILLEYYHILTTASLISHKIWYCSVTNLSAVMIHLTSMLWCSYSLFTKQIWPSYAHTHCLQNKPNRAMLRLTVHGTWPSHAHAQWEVLHRQVLPGKAVSVCSFFFKLFVGTLMSFLIKLKGPISF